MSRDKKFLELQHTWYTKLKAEGFEDVEWSPSQTRFESNSPFLHGFKAEKDRPTLEHTQNWYLLVQNYCTHATVLPKKPTKSGKEPKKLINSSIPHINKPDTQNSPIKLELTNKPIPPLHTLVLNLYLDGLSYRQIVRHVNANYTAKLSKRLRKRSEIVLNLSRVFLILAAHLPYVIEWNRQHPEGSLHKGSQDFIADDVLINEDSIASIAYKS